MPSGPTFQYHSHLWDVRMLRPGWLIIRQSPYADVIKAADGGGGDGGSTGRRAGRDDEVAAVGRQREQRQETERRPASEDLRADATHRRTASRRGQPPADFEGTSTSSQLLPPPLSPPPKPNLSIFSSVSVGLVFSPGVVPDDYSSNRHLVILSLKLRIIFFPMHSCFLTYPNNTFTVCS